MISINPIVLEWLHKHVPGATEVLHVIAGEEWGGTFEPNKFEITILFNTKKMTKTYPTSLTTPTN